MSSLRDFASREKMELASEASVDSASQSGHANSADWQEEVYKKITVMKENYLSEIRELYQKISLKLQQHDSLPQPSKTDQLEKLRIFKTMLEKIITFLQVSKMNVNPAHREKLASYEKQIVNFLNANRPRKPGQVPPHMQSTLQAKSQMQAQSHDNHMNPQLQSVSVQGPVMMQQNNSSLQQNPMDSASQSGHAISAEWQEEVYKKITVMKENYLPEIRELYQKISLKLQQNDSLPQPSKTDQLEKLRTFKTMLERIITFLQVSKINVNHAHREKLASYEKQIVNFLNAIRPRKPGQVPPHMQSMLQAQSQMQAQSHDSHMNPQLQSVSVQGPVMMQQNYSSLQQNPMSSLTGISNTQQNMIGSVQPGPNVEVGQGDGLASLQQGVGGSIHSVGSEHELQME